VEGGSFRLKERHSFGNIAFILIFIFFKLRSYLFVGNCVLEIRVSLRNFGFGAALQFEFEARLPLSQLFSCQTFNSSQAFSIEARICTNVSD